MACRASRNLHGAVTGGQYAPITVTSVMTTPVSPVITLDRATRIFGATRALDAVSATIHPGQFVAIIGRSGAGKTTLLRCLSRATSLSAGAIRFGDTDLAGLGGRAEMKGVLAGARVVERTSRLQTPGA
jgi:ABC-type multidrug transport system fused ATPase/permease subunit